MAQHQQPQHLGSQSNINYGKTPPSGEGKNALDIDWDETSIKRSHTSSGSKLSFENEFLFEDWDPFADMSIRPGGMADKQPSSEKKTAAPEVNSTAEKQPAEIRLPAEQSVPAERRRAPAEQNISAERRRAPAEQNIPAERRRAPAEQSPSAGRRRMPEEQSSPAEKRRTPAEQSDPPGRRRPPAKQSDPAGGRGATQNDQSSSGRWPAPEGYDNYIDTTDRSPGKGCLVIAAVLKFFVSLILAGMTAGFCYFLYSTAMLPDMFFLAVCAVLGVLLVAVLCLLWLSRKSGLLYTGIILTLVLAGSLTFGYSALSKAVGTLQSITDVSTAVSNVSVYVMQSDQAQTLDDAAGYTFGIVDVMGREAVDETIDQINTTLGTQIRTAEYSGIDAVVDALRNGDVQAIIVGQSQLDALEETEGYQNLAEEIRTVTNMRVERQIQANEGAQADVLSDTIEPFTVYISGIDSREEDMVAESRSDVNIIAAVNPQTHQVLLVSTPRDYYIPLSVSNGALDKLTHAGLYGVDVSIDTLEMLYGINIDYYFRVNFSGFKNIIDALGGITVNSDTSFWDYKDTYYFEEGVNELNGDQALAFARERKAFEDGDHTRSRHQMEVIRAVADKVLSTDLLKNYSSVLDAVSDSFDLSVPYELIAELVQDELSTGAKWDIVSYSVDGTDNWDAVCYSLPGTRYVLEPDQETVDLAKNYIDSVLAGETVDPAAA